jgi:hypothetical protein
MALGDIYLGASGSEVLLTPFGRKLKIVDSYPIVREGRTASGRQVADYGSTVKKQFVLDFSEIDGDKLDDIIAIQNLMAELSLQIYTTASLHDDYTVVMKPIERQRVLLLSPGLWSGVSITLDEV